MVYSVNKFAYSISCVDKYNLRRYVKCVEAYSPEQAMRFAESDLTATDIHCLHRKGKPERYDDYLARVALEMGYYDSSVLQICR